MLFRSQKASILGLRLDTVGMRAFFLEGETSFEGLGICVGVVGRDTGGTFRGERCFVGVGELRMVSSYSTQKD